MAFVPWQRSREFALHILAAAVALSTAATSLYALLALTKGLDPPFAVAVNTLVAVSYGGIGYLLARRRPTNLVGWLLLVPAALLAFGNFAPTMAKVAGITFTIGLDRGNGPA